MLVVTGCFAVPFLQTSSPEGTTTTVIIVRHAERDPGFDPPLIEEGVQRAEALKEALAENGVTAIYTTDLIRNVQTVQPLADELGLTVNRVSPVLFADIASTAAFVVDEIFRLHAGGTVLFCGNRGAQPVDDVVIAGINEEIYRRLGGTGRAPERYADMYIAVVPEEGETRFIKTEYGGPSSLD
ncbi:MAG: hypothetical protein HOP29_09480 [Phycisphaerales bacterium]|nr:hypothetical protein [Phycisphaerales bacterium]